LNPKSKRRKEGKGVPSVLTGKRKKTSVFHSARSEGGGRREKGPPPGHFFLSWARKTLFGHSPQKEGKKKGGGEKGTSFCIDNAGKKELIRGAALWPRSKKKPRGEKRPQPSVSPCPKKKRKEGAPLHDWVIGKKRNSAYEKKKKDGGGGCTQVQALT